MAEYITTDTELTSVADAIRAKGGTSAALTYPAGFVSAIEAIPTGGGSSYTLLATQEFEVSTTSTRASSVGYVDAGESAFTAGGILYVRVRDKAGVRSGYFFGSDSFFINDNAANGKTTGITKAGRFVILHNGNDINYWEALAFGQSTGYGVYANSVASNGRIQIYSRYNANSSHTIDGTYVVEVYLLDWPDGISPFE